jgi:hypothetical protein
LDYIWGDGFGYGDHFDVVITSCIVVVLTIYYDYSKSESDHVIAICRVAIVAHAQRAFSCGFQPWGKYLLIPMPAKNQS